MRQNDGDKKKASAAYKSAAEETKQEWAAEADEYPRKKTTKHRAVANGTLLLALRSCSLAHR